MEAILAGGLTNALVATLLAAVCLGVTCLWRNPFVARVLWLAVLLKLITPPLLELPIAWLDAETITDRIPPAVRYRPAPPVLAAVAEAASFGGSSMQTASPPVEPVTRPDVRNQVPGDDVGELPRSQHGLELRPPRAATRTAEVAAGIWLAGTVVMIAIIAFRVARFHRMVARTKPAPNSLQTQAVDLAAQLGLAKVPRVCIADSRLPPLVWSVGRGTAILLPVRLFNRLSPDKAAAVLAHEVVHLRRRDHWVRWIESAVLCAFWWHPIAWLARRKLQAAEERCCDADVLRAFPQFRRPYAEALLETLDFLSNTPPAACLATGFTQRSSVVRRFEMIVQSRPAARPLLSVRGAMLAIVLLVLLASPVASPANPETKKTVAEAEGIPCKVTLNDGTTMEGFIVRLADDRVVIRRRTSRVAGDTDEKAEPIEPPRNVDEPQQRSWDVELDECIRIGLLNRDVVRQLNTRHVRDGGGDELVLLVEKDGQLQLLDVRSGVANLLRDIETAYWELWRSHREFDAIKSGRDAALETWREVHHEAQMGQALESSRREAQSKALYFEFCEELSTITSDLHRAEMQLRHLIGLAHADGRSIRPSSEPKVETSESWSHVHVEALSRRPEILKGLERINALNEALQESRSNGEMARRTTQLTLTRERAILRDLELEVSHQVADAVRDVNRDESIVESRFVLMIAGQEEVKSVVKEYRVGRRTLDLALDALRRRVDAERSYYEALADYASSVSRLHQRKGSLLERHGVSISEP
jgi:beta-lactamase regulating signal transducer with metallopeptidase domain